MTGFTDTGWVLQASSEASGAMAGQRKGRTRQSGTAWTRSGCLTCKKRRKGCDKAKPSCNNCIKQGRICEGYGSLWVKPLGPSAQVFTPTDGVKRRRLSVSSPSQPSSPALSSYLDTWPDTKSSPDSISTRWSLPSTPRSRLIEEQVTQDRRSDTDRTGQTIDSDDRLVVLTSPCSPSSHLSGPEFHYLQYHVEHGSRLLANLETDDNPLRSLLIPRAMSSPLLMKAVCAVSALHLANRSQGFSAQTASANFYGRTLAGLRAALAECTTEILPDDAMLAVGLMCKYEIVRGSVKQWIVHLNALQRLIASRGGLIAMDRDAAVYLRGLYLYAYNMARISNRKRITAFESCPADTDLGTPRLDIYIGYTEDILNICARIAELPSLAGDVISLRLAIASFNDSLVTWSHTNTTYIIPQGLTHASLTRLQLVAECFRDGAFIYLHSILERMGMKSASHKWDRPNVPERNPYFTEWLPLISIPKSVAVHRCLARVESFPLDDHCEYSALTFPLFIAGCESDVPEHRGLVLRLLSKLQVNFGIGNVERAKEMLNILWARQDAHDRDQDRGFAQQVHWLDVLEELQWELILA
ncbi:uncharacterized protein N7459_006854 [Penicillium hispanicum]|uniref:uncharacterized protein n=1 Tax=Penicillium hispanicum TaxID=1080232 RepID=UPI00254152F4|nr:uncharacterized protein N7459_006854 [Penicillium hispanicum]KAJ5577890.1 hypothetical protein N7459_006854 [Penicillium hispanicum]